MESGIAASVLALGLAVALAVRPPLVVAVGATAVSGGASTGNAATALELKRGQVSSRTRFTRVEGTLRHDPE